MMGSYRGSEMTPLIPVTRMTSAAARANARRVRRDMKQCSRFRPESLTVRSVSHVVAERKTREIRIGNVRIGAANPIAVQSMTATSTQDVPASICQVELLEEAGADVIRIAVDNPKDVSALAEVRKARPNATLVVDLQENYRLAEKVAPFVQKLRYNPGHLYHLEREKPVQEKVRYPLAVARAYRCTT